MDRLKFYNGSISEDSATISINQRYGGTSKVNAKKSKTELLNNILCGFLLECGANASYDGNYLWINKVPVVLYFLSSNAFFTSYHPFNNSPSAAGSTSTTDIFNGMNYHFKVRLLGEPTTAFVLLISHNFNSPVFVVNGANFTFYKAENIINKRESVVYGWGNTDNVAAIDLDEEGNPVNIGRNILTASRFRLNTLVNDFSNNKDKFPLVEVISGIFKLEGCFCDLQNSPLPNASSLNNDAQTFVKLGDGVYYRYINGPLIRCIT